MSGDINRIIGNSMSNLSNQQQVNNNQDVHKINNTSTKIPSIDRVKQSISHAKQPSPSELKKIINKINENVSKLNKDVRFSYNETLKSLIVKVIDAKTGKVIREIPPQEVINLQKKLSEVVGIIFDSKEVER